MRRNHQPTTRDWLILFLLTVALAAAVLFTARPAEGHIEHPLHVWTKLMVMEENKFLLCRPAIPADSVTTQVVCFSLPRGALVLIPKPGYKLAPPTHKAGDR